MVHQPHRCGTLSPLTTGDSNMLARLFQVNHGAAGEQVRVNLRAAVNAADIRTEMYNGREHLVLPSYTLPDDVIMNGGLYPHGEIEASYNSLENTPAPLGHPQLDGEYISAYHPAAINAYHGGAFNRNVKRVGNRIYLEKFVDVEFAKTNARGQELLSAIEARTPIHTSTGVLLNQEPVANAAEVGYRWIARNMRFDHDAILINETGAATPDQGVGLFVNVDEAVPLAEPTEQETGLIQKILNMLRSHVVSEPAPAPITNTEASEMTLEELQAALDAQSAKQAAALNEALAPIQTELATVTAANAALAAQLKANTDAAEAEKKTAVAEEFGVVVANSLSGEALDAMFAKCAKAAPLIPGMPVTNKSEGDSMSRLID
ncbi:hypothetical protein Psm1vBMR14_gp08 [Pseudomonas phage MR14]|nr:hypothetical protein Psm1vBMR14_gp08 [Pseudomonas phage MR14]